MIRFRGIREIGYRDFLKNQNPLDQMSRFGKKVNYETKYSNEQLMQDHINQIKQKLDNKKASKSEKLEQELEFLQRIAEIENLEDSKKEFSRILIKDKFI